MPKFAMISMVAVAALIGAAVATPHPECEPCAAVKGQDLEALANNGKVGRLDPFVGEGWWPHE